MELGGDLHGNEEVVIRPSLCSPCMGRGYSMWSHDSALITFPSSEKECDEERDSGQTG